MVNEKFTTPGN